MFSKNGKYGLEELPDYEYFPIAFGSPLVEERIFDVVSLENTIQIFIPPSSSKEREKEGNEIYIL